MKDKNSHFSFFQIIYEPYANQIHVKIVNVAFADIDKADKYFWLQNFHFLEMAFNDNVHLLSYPHFNFLESTTITDQYKRPPQRASITELFVEKKKNNKSYICIYKYQTKIKEDNIHTCHRLSFMITLTCFAD